MNDQLQQRCPQLSLVTRRRGARHLRSVLFGLVCAVGLPCTGVAGARSDSISAAQLRAYLATNPHQQRYTPSINPVIEVLTGTGRRSGPTAAAGELARQWRVPTAVAEAAIELVVVQSGDSGSTQQERVLLLRRQQAAVARIVDSASQSREAWRVVLWQQNSQDRCSDTKLRDRYLHIPWAVADLLHSKAYDCVGWLPAVVGVAPVTSLLYGRIAESSSISDRDQLLALRALRDSLVHDAVPWQDPARLYAQRRYWLLLAGLGIWQTLLADAQQLSLQEIEAVLDGHTGAGAPAVDGFELEGAGTPGGLRCSCRAPGWSAC
jgi:hypothetical protein